MLRPGLLHQHVGWLRTCDCLQSFLQRRFVVCDLRRSAGRNEFFKFGQHNPAKNQRAGGFESRVQKNGADDRFKSIDQQRSLVAAATFFLAPSQAQIFA